MARKKKRSKFLPRLLAAAVAVTTLIGSGAAGGMAAYAAEMGTAEAEDAVPADVEKIAFSVTIYDADVRKQNFGQVSNSFIRIVNNDSNEELIRYDLGEDFSIETAVVVAELYRHNGEWKFNAVGSGFEGGLHALCKNYGVNIG